MSPGDSEKLATALIRALEEPFLLDRLRQGCRDEASRFSIETYTARLEQLYRQAAAGIPGPA